MRDRTIGTLIILLLALAALAACSRANLDDIACARRGQGWRLVDLTPHSSSFGLACVHVDSIAPARGNANDR